MKEEDLPFVLEIENLSFPNPWREMTFRGEIYNHPISSPLVLVHKSDGRIIGYIVFWHIREDVQINNISIHPDFRRQGFAEAVMLQVLAQIQAEGARFVTLEVRPSNVAALSLYRKLEFEVIGIRENYYRTPQEHAVVMGKKLS